MRATLSLDDHVLAIIRQYAEALNISLGEAASDLINRGAVTLPQFQTKNGLLQLDVHAGSQPVDHAMIDAHKQAHTWFTAKRNRLWATCPLTQPDL